MLRPAIVREIIDSYLIGKKYFTIEALKHILKGQKVNINPVALKQLLHNLTKDKILFDAGRGWYSSIELPLDLDKRPMQKLIKIINANFPDLTYSIWSGAQLKPFLGSESCALPFYLFVNKTSIPLISNGLKKKGCDVLPNPHTDEIAKFFNITDSSVIIRPKVTEEPVEGEFATIEKILVDVYIEMDKTFLISDAAYELLMSEFITNSRINMARMLRYASRRRVKKEISEKYLYNKKESIVV